MPASDDSIIDTGLNRAGGFRRRELGGTVDA
jgi:hypothetical protein